MKKSFLGSGLSAIAFFMLLNASAQSNQAPLFWKMNGNNPSASDYIGTNSYSPLIFKTDQSERLRISPDGNVGIGTSTPTAKLDVNGSAKISSLAAGTGYKLVGVDATGNLVPITGNFTAGQLGDAVFVEDMDWHLNGNNNVTTSDFIGTINNADMVFRTNNMERMRLTKTGQLRIGTQDLATGSHTDYVLAVAGKFVSQSAYVTINNWADHILRKDYRLMPLSDVEAFINKNEHLPGIPSEKELLNEGTLNLADMQTRHMAKIEELYLYIIELNKQVKELEKQVEELKKAE